MLFLRWLTAILLLTASLGQLNRLFIGDASDVVLYANDLLIGIMAGWYLLESVIARRSWRIPPVMLWLVVWILWAVISLLAAKQLLSGSEWLVSLSYLVRYVAYALVMFWVAYDSVVYLADWAQQKRMVSWWLAILMVSGLLMAIGGFIQLFVLPDLSVLAKYGWDPHLDRLVTAMLDPNYAGCYFSLLISIAVSYYLHIKQRYSLKIGLLVTIVVLLIALLLTFSRSGYVMLAVSLGIIAMVKSRWLLIVGVSLAALTVILVPRVQERLIGAIQVDASAQPRIVSWQNSIEIAEPNLLLGVGFNAYRYAQDRYGILSLDESGNAGAGADSSWLFILATTGVPGLLFFLANYVGLTFISIRLYRLSTHTMVKALALGVSALLIGLGAASQFNNAIFYTWIMQPLWLVCGLIVALMSVTKETKRTAVNED